MSRGASIAANASSVLEIANPERPSAGVLDVTAKVFELVLPML